MEAKDMCSQQEFKISLKDCPCTGVNLPRLIQPALLYIIAQEPTHGYAIMQKLSESGLFGESGPDSAGVYRFLKSMENDGSLYAAWDASESGPARKRYRITSRGLACLNQWRKTLFAHQEFISRMIAFMQL